MKIRLFNAKIMISPQEEIFSGEIHIEGNKITNVLSSPLKKTLVFDRQIDCKGNLLMSGFCNAHTHSAMSLFRGLAEGLSLDRWLNDIIFPLEKKLSDEDIYWGALLQTAEYAKSGITAVCDMYSRPEMTYEAVKGANIAVAFCGGLNDLQHSVDFVLKDNSENYTKFNNIDSRVKYFIGLHAEYTCSDTLIEKTADLAVELGSKTYIHLSETLNEVGSCTVRRGLTPPEYLHKIGFFDNGGLAAHCTYLDKNDISLLAQKKIVPVINGASNLKLASGIAPVYSMLKGGLLPALGTDGTASNNSSNMFKEMYLYSCLQKVTLKAADIVTAKQALCAATIDGYKALGFDGGFIKTGGFADIILIDLQAPNLNPPNNIKNHLVYSADNSNVLMTIAGGKIIYENGFLDIGESVDIIYSKCRQIVKRVTS